MVGIPESRVRASKSAGASEPNRRALTKKDVKDHPPPRTTSTGTTTTTSHICPLRDRTYIYEANTLR